MPFFELPNGKTIYLSAIDLLDLTDEKLQELMAGDCGDFIENPFQKLPGGSRFNRVDEVFDADVSKIVDNPEVTDIENLTDDTTEEKDL